jgi:hypothetical protein
LQLSSAVDNPRINRAIEEVSKDPQAWLKYKDDPEVSSYFMKMMGVFGKQVATSRPRCPAGKILSVPMILYFQRCHPCSFLFQRFLISNAVHQHQLLQTV